MHKAMSERGRVLRKAVLAQIDTVSMAHLHLSCMRESLSCSCMFGFSFVIWIVPCEIRDSRQPRRYNVCVVGTPETCTVGQISIVMPGMSSLLHSICAWSGNRSRLHESQHRLGSFKLHSHCCIYASRTVLNLRSDQDGRGCARIVLDPRAGTKRRVVAGISVILAVHSKAWRGLSSLKPQAHSFSPPSFFLMIWWSLSLLPLRLFERQFLASVDFALTKNLR